MQNYSTDTTYIYIYKQLHVSAIYSHHQSEYTKINKKLKYNAIKLWGQDLALHQSIVV
jgi:hypothetical protein